MDSANLTFGIELEFLAIHNHESDIGRTIYTTLLHHGIPATGWEPLDDDISDPTPPHTRWRVDTDNLQLSSGEDVHVPPGWLSESVELSSRKFHFSDSPTWRREIAAVLDVLRQVERTGARFLTNESAGFHVHVGNDTRRIPLRVAKNVFQVVTAFERCLDRLHTIPRISVPTGLMFPACLPPSFFYAYNDRVYDPMTGENSLLARLVDIEVRDSYDSLSRIFAVTPPGAVEGTSGHNSAYNFDNLLGEEADHSGPRRLYTGTIEFRQHTGTLDFLSITAWVELTCQIVRFAASAPASTHLDLLLRGMDQTFTLQHLFAVLGCSQAVLDHYLDDVIVGRLADLSLGECVGVRPSHPQMELLLAQNDDECGDRCSEAGVALVVADKLKRGLYGTCRDFDALYLPLGAADDEFVFSFVETEVGGVDTDTETGFSCVMARALMRFEGSYRRDLAGFRSR